MDQERNEEKKSRTALWIVLSIIGVIMLVAVICMMVVGMFSESVHDLFDGAAEQLGEPPPQP